MITVTILVSSSTFKAKELVHATRIGGEISTLSASDSDQIQGNLLHFLAWSFFTGRLKRLSYPSGGVVGGVLLPGEVSDRGEGVAVDGGDDDEEGAFGFCAGDEAEELFGVAGLAEENEGENADVAVEGVDGEEEGEEQEEERSKKKKEKKKKKREKKTRKKKAEAKFL